NRTTWNQMSNLIEHSTLEEFLEGLNHLFIDIVRLSDEPDYRDKRGGYCDLQVKTLDREIPSARKLVAAKKLFLSARPHNPKRLALRLARELKVWARLRHPHVLPLVGFYVGDNYDPAVLISEYMVHGDLKDYIVKMKPSYDERLYLVRDLTDGLAYLHTQFIRHGDLKSGNVLVNPQRRALLADFGLSKALDIGSTGFTTGNDARATVRFSSPEIMLEGVDAQSLANDIWSWACLVLEAMTDKAPFADIQVDHKIILSLTKQESPCSGEALALDLPQFSALLANCWSYQSDQRPTVVQCLDVVQHALSPLVLELFEHHTPWEFSAAPEEPFDQNGFWVPDLFPEELSEQDPSWGLTGAPPEAFDQNGSWASDLFPEERPEQPPTRSPTPQPSQTPQASPQATQPSQTDLSNGSTRFYTYFMPEFSSWLEQRQPSLDPRVDEKKAELPELFLVVGAVGGWRAVSEKMLWPAVSAKIGFLSFVGPVLHSKPKEAELLSEVYENLLAEFEVHWHTSLKPHDPGSIFPLPPQLQHLHPEIEKLAASLVLLRQQQEQFPHSVEAESPPPVDDNATGTRRRGLGIEMSNGQVGHHPLPGSPPEPSASGSHPSPRSSQIGLHGRLQEQLRPPQGGPANAPPLGGNEIFDGIAPNQTPIIATPQTMSAGPPKRGYGTFGSQARGPSQPGVDLSRIPPQAMEQAMRALGYAGRAQDSLNPEERKNLHGWLRASIQSQRRLRIGTGTRAPGANPILPRAPQPGPSGPQGRIPGTNFLQQLPPSHQMMEQPVQRIMKRPGSPSIQSDVSTNGPYPERKRLRTDKHDSSEPASRQHMGVGNRPARPTGPQVPMGAQRPGLGQATPNGQPGHQPFAGSRLAPGAPRPVPPPSQHVNGPQPHPLQLQSQQPPHPNAANGPQGPPPPNQGPGGPQQMGMGNRPAGPTGPQMSMGAQPTGLPQGIPNRQPGHQPFAGSPLGLGAGGPHPSPRTSQMGSLQGLRGHPQQPGQHPQQQGGPANAPTPGGSGMPNGVGPNQTPMMAAAQKFMHAGRPGSRSGTPESQVGGGSQPGA
ncbi:hypothetical protein FRC01_007983, partial [Tulasnella sp. 417]